MLNAFWWAWICGLQGDGAEAHMKPHSATVLLLADRRSSQTARLLKASGYRVMTTFTPDHAVAICVNNPVDAVILDQHHFIETEGWSVAKSLKMIRNAVCVLLVVRGKMIGHNLPAGVDAVVPEHDSQSLLVSLKNLLRGF
jgi:DNA-binding response OmpR family regulator